ncbi:MAG: hypothetical protein ACRDTT_26235, partial [Pseudonocardiaceae bacterium]
MGPADLNDDLLLEAIWKARDETDETRRLEAARAIARLDLRGRVQDVQRLADREPSGRVRFWLSVALAKAGGWQLLAWEDWDQVDLGDPVSLAADVAACGPFPTAMIEAIQEAASRSWVLAAFLPSRGAAIPVGGAHSSVGTAATPDDESELPDFDAGAAVDEPSAPPSIPPTREAYPRVDAPDVVVVDHPFDVTVGIAPRRDRTLVGTGAFDVSDGDLIDMMLTYDPQSLRLDGESRLSLPATLDDPYPSATVRFTALDGDDLGTERRIGVHYLIEGVVVGIAWRVVVAVSTPDEVAG